MKEDEYTAIANGSEVKLQKIQAAESLRIFFIIKTTDALISQIYSGTKLYMFRAVPLPIIRSYPLRIRHWYMLYRFEDS
jgi:hypothetical protein